MKDEWIGVDPDELPDVRCVAYSEFADVSMQYRIIPAGQFKYATSATHYLPLAPPTYDAKLYHFCPLCNAHCNCDNNVCECSCSDDEI